MANKNGLEGKWNQLKGAFEEQTGRPIKGRFDTLKGKLEEITDDLKQRNTE